MTAPKKPARARPTAAQEAASAAVAVAEPPPRFTTIGDVCDAHGMAAAIQASRDAVPPDWQVLPVDRHIRADLAAEVEFLATIDAANETLRRVLDKETREARERNKNRPVPMFGLRAQDRMAAARAGLMTITPPREPLDLSRAPWEPPPAPQQASAGQADTTEEAAGAEFSGGTEAPAAQDEPPEES